MSKQENLLNDLSLPQEKEHEGTSVQTLPGYPGRLEELERCLQDAKQKNQDLKHQLTFQVDSSETEQLALLRTQNYLFVQELAELRKQIDAYEVLTLIFIPILNSRLK